MVLVGDSGVGKSCLLLRFADDTFSESYISTIGVDFRFKTLTVDGKIVKLQIWDTAGQERFRTITSAYYRGADGVMLVFDKTSRDTFDHIPDWLDEINKYSETSSRVIVGNKQDSNETIQVDQETGKKFAESRNMSYVETSALNGSQVALAFEIMARELISKKTATSQKGNKLTATKVKKNLSCCQKL
jgi:Ras-related protein Rab-1A